MSNYEREEYMERQEADHDLIRMRDKNFVRPKPPLKMECPKLAIDAQDFYNALKLQNPEAYRKAINYAEGINLSNSISSSMAVEIETAMVVLACELLGIKP